MTFSTRALASHTLAALTLAVAGCSDDPVATLNTIRILDMAGGTDTVLAPAARPMVVEIRDPLGNPAVGMEVRFVAVPPGNDSTAAARGMYVCPTSRPRCATFADHQNFDVIVGTTDTTDNQGRAEAKVQFGVIAGPAIIEVRVPELDVVREVSFTTLPGSLAGVTAAVPDTAVYVGSSYDLGARATDRFGNTRAEAVTVTSLTPAVAVITEGRLTAQMLGRGRVRMQAGATVDTAYVSVPPRGRLVAYGGGGPVPALVLVNTDGTNRRVLLETFGNNGSADATWSPDGRRIVFTELLPEGSARLQLIDTLGNRLPFLAEFSRSTHAAASADSIFFFGASITTGQTGIYRASPDGSGATFLSHGTQPAPSPDGSRVAYRIDEAFFVRDLTTGDSTRILELPVLHPAWSPTDDLIGFVWDDGDLEVYVVRPDGTDLRPIATGFHQDVTWSPDGQWIAASFWAGGVELIRLSDGERLPIPSMRDLGEPAWQPALP